MELGPRIHPQPPSLARKDKILLPLAWAQGWSGAQLSPAAEPPPGPAPRPARRPYLHTPLVLRKPRWGAAAPQSLCVLQGSRKVQGQTRASSASCGIVRGKWGPRWGSHFPRGGHAAETQAGGIGESGGHGWPTTSREAGAGQTLDAEEPRDSVGCLAVGSGPTPRGKEGSLHGPEAIGQEVWQRQSLQSRCQGQGGQTNRTPQSWRSHHRPIFL